MGKLPRMIKQQESAGAAGIGSSALMNLLNSARRAVPAVDYALGAAGIAAAGGLVVGILGNGRGAIIIMGGVFIAMLLLFSFARLLTAKSASATAAGMVLLWSVVVFFSLFLLLTVTATIASWPCNWARILGLLVSCGPSSSPPLP
jgi:hypothetical protein